MPSPQPPAPIRLVGLCGPAGSGKSAAAIALYRSTATLPHANRAWMRASFAEPIRAMLRAMGVPDENLDRFKSREIPGMPGSTARSLMRSLGTEWGRQCVHPDHWVRVAELRYLHHVAGMKPGGGIVFDDVRFANEAQMLKRYGGRIVEVRRPGLDYQTDHPTECGLPRDLIDHTIEADTLEALEAAILAYVAPSEPHANP